MRVAVVLVLAISLGCGQSAAPPVATSAPSPPAPHLRFVDFGATENENQLPFALKIDNTGVSAQFDAIEMHTSNESIIGEGTSAKNPAGFSAAVALMNPMFKDGTVSVLPEGTVVRLPGGHTSDVWGLLVWKQADNPPPQLAIVAATFTLKYRGVDVLTTPAYSFVLESQAGVLKQVMLDAGQHLDQSADILHVLQSINANSSTSVRELRERLEAVVPPAA